MLISALAAYRQKHELTLEAFGARLRHPKPAQTVLRWERGERIPDRQGMADIHELTGGAVRPEHFYDLPGRQEPPPLDPARDAGIGERLEAAARKTA
jgi:transcriptional regulator with XRE-family HTH domain